MSITPEQDYRNMIAAALARIELSMANWPEPEIRYEKRPENWKDFSMLGDAWEDEE